MKAPPHLRSKKRGDEALQFRGLLFSLAIVLILASNHTNVHAQYFEFECHSAEQSMSSGADCTNLSTYIPQLTDPVKTVRIAFHVMQKEAPNEKENFDENNQDHVDFLLGVFDRVP